MIRLTRKTTETFVIPQRVFMGRLGLGSPRYTALVVEETDRWDPESQERVVVIRIERVRREERPNR